jgi:hypothetical protein
MIPGHFSQREIERLPRRLRGESMRPAIRNSRRRAQSAPRLTSRKSVSKRLQDFPKLLTRPVNGTTDLGISVLLASLVPGAYQDLATRRNPKPILPERSPKGLSVSAVEISQL